MDAHLVAVTVHFPMRHWKWMRVWSQSQCTFPPRQNASQSPVTVRDPKVSNLKTIDSRLGLDEPSRCIFRLWPDSFALYRP
jgi:hypothetical protein